MFWLKERNEIWILIDSPTSGKFYWRVVPDEYEDGMPESDPAIHPPAGRYQPVRGFGLAWRTIATLRDQLGWAVDQEVGFNTTLTYYPQGFFDPDCHWQPKSGIYELTDNQGVRYRFVGEGGEAMLVTSEKGHFSWDNLDLIPHCDLAAFDHAKQGASPAFHRCAQAGPLIFNELARRTIERDFQQRVPDT